MSVQVARGSVGCSMSVTIGLSICSGSVQPWIRWRVSVTGSFSRNARAPRHCDATNDFERSVHYCF